MTSLLFSLVLPFFFLTFDTDASATTATAAEAVSTASAFSKLADDYWETQMRLSPLWATFVNHPRYHDKLDDNSAAGREDERKAREALLNRLKALDRAKLTEQEKVSLEVMRLELELALERPRHKFWQWDVDQMDGPQTWISSVVEFSQPMKTEADAEALLKRLAAMPRFFDNHIRNLREGLSEGRVAARVPVEKTIAQIEGILKIPADQSPFMAAARRLPDPLRAKYEPLVARAVQSQAYAAYGRYLDFLKNEYLARARKDKIGLSALPGGLEAYRFQIRSHTTVDKTPEELHALGLKEVAALSAEQEAIARKLGHQGNLKAFIEKLRKDPRMFFATREELLADAEALVARAKKKLPEAFGILPKTDLVVKPIEPHKEKNDVAARYYPPPDDLSRPGIYFINTYEPKTRARYKTASLAFHEGVPGHHLQIAIALEQRGLPAFRRNGGFNAFVEGWALYSERLADELGLYPDDLARFGMLSDQAWRAVRLVVDTGLHAKGWSRQQAIDYMKDHLAASEHEIVQEVDRYTIWPGQALSYKVGQIELLALREESKKKLGAAFDLKRFHDKVLSGGALPLPVLRSVILSP